MRRKKKPSSLSVKPPRRKGATRGRVVEGLSPIYARIRAAIRQIPRGKVSTYGAVARAAGFSGAARQVARALHTSVGLPWQRVLGSGGEIKLRGDSAMEQRFRLEAEGVRFRGKKVDMKAHEFRNKDFRL
jgi:methylated-DNA-protein-cysteine methyltransferase-like protein